MKHSQVTIEKEQEAEKLLDLLERHWRHRYQPNEVQERIKELLQALKKRLAQDSADARFVADTYRRWRQHLALKQEVDLAGQVLKRMVAELSTVVVSLIPFSLIDLPTLFTLAHHFHIDMLPADKKNQEPWSDIPGTTSSS